MTLTLTVDGERWRGHLRAYAESHPGLVPVAKGNGYGFTIGRLARRTQWLKDRGLGLDTLAVGTYEELPHVATRFDGRLLVLTPWRPWIDDLPEYLAHRVIHTVGRPSDLDELLTRQPRARLVLERMTSMMRHGFEARDLWATRDQLERHPHARVEGVALHLPLAHGSHLPEVTKLLDDIAGIGLASPPTVWVSHLTDAELEQVRTSYPDFTFRPRVGTDLWLGDRVALRVTAKVLDVHPVERGVQFGYRGRSAPRSGHLLVVSGGTTHGIGLESPMGESSLKSRAATIARGGLDAVGVVKSPFFIDGKQRMFAEPPHMQASMLFLPTGARVPEVGDEIDARVRYTATTFDRIVVG